MASVPGHPIYLDAIRRVVHSMQAVDNWTAKKGEEASNVLASLVDGSTSLEERKRLFESGDVVDRLRTLLTTDPFDMDNGGIMPLIEATGPGVFTDAVISYLQARYGIHWSQLHDIQTTTRIGEIAIVPITGFAPFLKPSWQRSVDYMLMQKMKMCAYSVIPFALLFRWKGVTKGPMAVVGDVTHSQALVYHRVSTIN